MVLMNALNNTVQQWLQYCTFEVQRNKTTFPQSVTSVIQDENTTLFVTPLMTRSQPQLILLWVVTYIRNGRKYSSHCVFHENKSVMFFFRASSQIPGFSYRRPHPCRRLLETWVRAPELQRGRIGLLVFVGTEDGFCEERVQSRKLANPLIQFVKAEREAIINILRNVSQGAQE